jgi:formylglycine-generating enzyme required for sulfatase activity
MSTESSASAESPDAARPKYPYPGLRPFEAEEWSIFFGRERMVDDVIDRLAANRLVLIHGASGAGKSSLVRAGVLPKLARQHRRAGAPWQTCTMRPSGGPLWNLAKELAGLEGTSENLERIGQIVAQFSRRGATLSTVIASLENFGGQRLCLLVDQFEELFRFEKETSREEAELFVDLLVRSDAEVAARGSEDGAPSGQASPVHVIVTMRSEYLGECARFSGLAETINRTQYLVPRMERDALLRAIRRPAQFYGGGVTLDLAERLIADAAGREDELPLIAHGLMLMWHDALANLKPGGEIVLDAAPLEAARGLSRMLSAHADAAFEAAAPDPERRAAAERLFRALIDVNVEGKAIRRPQAFRRLVAITAIGADSLRGMIEVLRRDGVSFLTPYPPQPITDTTPIDIGHEALIRCWDRLSDPQNGWLKREFDDGLVWRSLLIEAKGFEHDRRRVLSPATTEERSGWWRERKVNATWADRYGGNFALVDELLASSRKAAADAKRRSFLTQSAIYALLIGMIAVLVGWINQSNIADEWRLVTVTWPYERTKVTPFVLSAAKEQALKPGQSFRECAQDCPEMVVLPAGTFEMGSPPTDKGAYANETPQHPVTFAKQFAVSKYELTFADWDACVEGGGCNGYRPSDQNWGRGQRPVINIDWDDAQAYVAWLSQVTGKTYRLLSEAEYEYAIRGGTTTIYPWGDDIQLNGQAMANCNGCGSKWDKRQTAPVGSFPPNKFGLYDMVGNVFEWTQDCEHDDYKGAPSDGSAWLAADGGDCTNRIDRGASWFNTAAIYLRAASRQGVTTAIRYSDLGTRIARTLGP